PCATGRIGAQVDRARLLRGVRAGVAALSPDGLPAAAQAITTTDAFPKTAVRRLRLGGRSVTVAALGKGGGMIAPRMATLLVFVVTDARVAAAAARHPLRDAVDGTLNAITVGGDTRTNAPVLRLAGGAAPNRTRGAGGRSRGRARGRGGACGPASWRSSSTSTSGAARAASWPPTYRSPTCASTPSTPPESCGRSGCSASSPPSWR